MTVLACDMGGTRIKAAVVSGGKLLACDGINAHSERGLRERLPALADLFRRLCEMSGTKISDCAGVSVCFPSVVNPITGRVLDEYGKYGDAPQIDLRTWAREELGLPLAIENDARMALIGEWRHGAARHFEDVAMVTLGTGIGTAILSEGRIVRGKHGQAAILCGHLTVRAGGRLCRCGNVGCAETEASTAILPQLARERTDFEGSALSKLAVLDYAAVFQHAAAGDPCAKGLRDHSLQVWSSVVVNLIHAFDPEIVIMGGGIMASAGAILPAVRDYVKRHARTPWGAVRIEPSELGDQAALVAAEWLVQEQLPYN